MAAVAFSATAGLEQPLRNLINFAKAGASFSAKQLCSRVLMAGMDPDQVLKEDLAAGQGLIQTRIEPRAGRVEASALFGLFRSEAVQSGERGCTWRMNGQPAPGMARQASTGDRDPKPTGGPWRLVDMAPAEPPEIDRQALNDVLDRAFEENEPLTPKRTRAVVVVQDGWVIPERYAQGIRPDMPLIGWSMSKSITHALIGLAIQEEILDPDSPPNVPEWIDQEDPRRRQPRSTAADEQRAGLRGIHGCPELRFGANAHQGSRHGRVRRQPAAHQRTRQKVELFIRDH